MVCWLFAIAFLQFDQIGNYDIRYNLRGTQKVSQDVVLITIKASDISKMYDLRTSSLIKAAEISDVSDSFYWDRQLWYNTLKTIIAQNPKKVGVTLYFGNNVGTTRLTSAEDVLFHDKRIVWAANSNEPERLSLPLASTGDRSNIAHVETLKDDDGIVRRIMTSTNTLPNLAQRLTEKPDQIVTEGLSVINYKGRSLFTEISINDVLSTSLPPNFFTGKIILIGSEASSTSEIQTPIGLMTRHEFWAIVSENMMTGSFIKKLPGLWYAVFLFALNIVAILMITRYPLVVALFTIIWLGTLTSAFSAWVFDSFNIWVPIATPLSLFIFVWILFIGYQALRIEQAHTRLQQQQNYLAELEQLKNNFVSLISHDLKTPIAKIQGVLDRLLAQGPPTPELREDLSNLKEYSDELNRYIQSILKVLRVESRDFKIIKETADINGIIENAVERLRPLALSKNIRIEMQLEPMFLIEIDVTLMTEVFLNIIENAIKYTPASGFVRIKSFETEQEVCVDIQDSGEGISAEDQEIIWNKFTRGKSQDYKTKGSGLGLYLVKYFVELHGGQISVQSELNKGTQFTVKLPIESTEST